MSRIGDMSWSRQMRSVVGFRWSPSHRTVSQRLVHKAKVRKREAGRRKSVKKQNERDAEGGSVRRIKERVTEHLAGPLL